MYLIIIVGRAVLIPRDVIETVMLPESTYEDEDNEIKKFRWCRWWYSNNVNNDNCVNVSDDENDDNHMKFVCQCNKFIIW